MKKSMVNFLSYNIDINTQIYGGNKGFVSRSASSIKRGDTSNTSRWEFPNHIGTHIDFPYHFYKNGQTIDNFAAEFWIIDGGKVQILEVNLPDINLLIEPDFIKTISLNFNAELLLIKTGFHKYRGEEKYWNENPGISTELADWIKQHFKKLKMLGIDSISISSWQHRDIGRKVHRKLLDPEKPVLIIEDMDLSKVNDNTTFKTVYVAPFIASKSDGSPCTVIAEVEKL